MVLQLLSLGVMAVASFAAPSAEPRDVQDTHRIPRSPPANALGPILPSFVSYSIEFAFWPDFAGNKSSPNKFSDNLLRSIGKYSGARPVIRVGGNTQDYALWDPSLKLATNATYAIPGISYPNLLYYGPSYFESYGTFQDTTYIHGFNMGKNGTVGMDSLLHTVPLVCDALQGGRLEYLELGNEPDQFKTTSRGIVRPASWREPDYVEEWQNKTRAMRQVWEEHCPNERFEFIGPSMAGLNGALKVLDVYRLGYTSDGTIKQASAHHYMGSSDDPGVTLANKLLNRTETLNIIARHRANADQISGNFSIPYVVGEGNSLAREGRAGLSDSFGAALWVVDFGLAAASQGRISRFHFHQGTNYRYSGWQPINTPRAVKQTRPPFYGHLALAAALGDSGKHAVRVVNTTLNTEHEAAYAIYNNDRLTKIVVLNLNEYNATVADPLERPVDTYSFRVPHGVKRVSVQRLMGAGSDAVTGLTFDGYSYNADIREGEPVRLHNVTIGETIRVQRDNVVNVKLPWSSAAILNL